MLDPETMTFQVNGLEVEMTPDKTTTPWQTQGFAMAATKWLSAQVHALAGANSVRALDL